MANRVTGAAQSWTTRFRKNRGVSLGNGAEAPSNPGIALYFYVTPIHPAPHRTHLTQGSPLDFSSKPPKKDAYGFDGLRDSENPTCATLSAQSCRKSGTTVRQAISYESRVATWHEAAASVQTHRRYPPGLCGCGFHLQSGGGPFWCPVKKPPKWRGTQKKARPCGSLGAGLAKGLQKALFWQF